MPPYEKIWDAIIVGAGPAGSISAVLLAQHGWRVLLLERARWPREKVCGGCVNASAIHMLTAIGLSDVLRGRAPLNQFAVSIANRRLDLALPAGAAISRQVLDQRLVSAAQKQGCEFLPNASASLNPIITPDSRQLTINTLGHTTTLQARVILACDGIAGTLLENEPWADWTIAKNSYFGVATTLPPGKATAELAPRGTIGMHVAHGGYVGTARYADGSTHLAAALHPDLCKSAGGPLPFIQKILRENHLEIPEELATARFHGAPLLTRKRKTVAGHRILAVGDACGYLEPFTGEGIAWAIQSARDAVQLLTHSNILNHPWSDLSEHWNTHHQLISTRRQRPCRFLQQLIRRPALARATITCINALPPMRRLAESITHAIGGRSLGALYPPQGVVNDCH